MAMDVKRFFHVVTLTLFAWMRTGSYLATQPPDIHFHPKAHPQEQQTAWTSRFKTEQDKMTKKSIPLNLSLTPKTDDYQSSSGYDHSLSISRWNNTAQLLEFLKCEDKNMKESNTACPHSCKGKCGHVTIASNDNLYPCHCDQACWLYGDCCKDYYTRCLQISINTTSVKILSSTLSTLQTYSQVLHLHAEFHWSRLSRCVNLISTKVYFHMVVSCSSRAEFLAQFEDIHRDFADPLHEGTDYFMGLSKEEIKQRCERNGQNGTGRHLLDHTHVTLIQNTAVHFYNVFCAICNGVSPSHVTAWMGDVACDNITDPSLLFEDNNLNQATRSNNCTTQNLVPPTCYLRTCFPQGNNESDSTELTDSNTGTSGSNDIKNGSPACCKPGNDTNSNLCERYQCLSIDSRRDSVYKNPHCLVCSLSDRGHLKNDIMDENTGQIRDWITNLNKFVNTGNCDCLSFSNSLFTLGNSLGDSTFQPESAADESLRKLLAPSYRILFDFRSHLTTVTINQTIRTIETKTCPQNQVFVPLFESCRQIQCMPGTYSFGNQCLPVNSCLENGTSENGTCRENEGQELNYTYLPFPGGSKSVRLNIALDYVLTSHVTSDSLLHINMHSNNSDDYEDDSVLDVDSPTQLMNHTTTPKANTKNSSYSQNSGTCTSTVDGMSHLFTVSSLRNIWVQQIKNKEMNWTKSTQESYNKMVDSVRRLIPVKIKKHLDNLYQTDKFVLCRGITCLVYAFNVEEDYTDRQNMYPYNPCNENPGKLLKKKYGKHRSDVCLSFIIHLNSSDDLDTFIRATKVMARDIINVAHDNNFALSWLEVTNRVTVTSKEPVGETETHSMRSDINSNTNREELCESGETLTYKVTTIEHNQSGTYTVNVNGAQIQLGKFAFSMELHVNPVTVESQINVANVSWCWADISKFQCESLQAVLYEPPNFIIYNRILILTTMAEKFKLFLYNHSLGNENEATIKDLTALFAANYGDTNAVAIKDGSFFRVRNGVLVCSNLSNTHQIENVTFLSMMEFRFMPDSKAETIATSVASILSITCLMCTLFVYSFMPSLRNVPGKIVMSLSGALLCAQVLFLCCQKLEGLACEIYAAVHHAVWLASFAWLASMSINLACVLNIQSSVHTDIFGCSIFKFSSVLCWGIPFLVASSCLALFKTNLVEIGYGQNGVCWIGNFKALLIVFGAPVFLILAVTSVCAVVVVRAIRNSINFRSKSTVTRRKSRKQLILCVNLSLLMGFNWSFYFLAVVVDNTIVWTAHILVNGSQGLYIFLCFVARKSLLFKLITNMKLKLICSEKSNHSFDSPKASANRTATIVISDSSPNLSVKALNSLASSNPSSPFLNLEHKDLNMSVCGQRQLGACSESSHKFSEHSADSTGYQSGQKS